MMKNRHIFLIVIITLVLDLSAFAVAVLKEGAELGKWTMDYDAALTLAEEKKLAVFLDFTGSDWCGWCKLMDRSVFSTSDWSDFASKKIALVKIDFPQDPKIVPEKYKKRNMDLQNKFGISGYPTYVVLDSDGKTELGRLGASQQTTPAKFQADVLKMLRRSENGVQEFAKDLDPDKGRTYVESFAELKKTQAAFDAWLQTKPSSDDANLQKFFEFNEKINALSRTIEVIEAQKYATTLDPEKAAEYLNLYDRLHRAKSTFDKWVESRPDHNEMNERKKLAYQKNIEQITVQIESF